MVIMGREILQISEAKFKSSDCIWMCWMPGVNHVFVSSCHWFIRSLNFNYLRHFVVRLFLYQNLRESLATFPSVFELRITFIHGLVFDQGSILVWNESAFYPQGLSCFRSVHADGWWSTVRVLCYAWTSTYIVPSCHAFQFGDSYGL